MNKVNNPRRIRRSTTHAVWCGCAAFVQNNARHKLVAGQVLSDYLRVLPISFFLVVSACGSGSSDGALNTSNLDTLDNGMSGLDSVANETVESDTTVETIATNSVDVTELGQVRTIEINGVVLSSLPESVVEPSIDRVALGRLLFWDPILSGDSDVACATCHLPEFGYADGRARSIGVGGVGAGPARVVGHTGLVPRNAPTVLNTIWNGITEFGLFDPDQAPMFWDSRTRGLVNQALEPIRSREEMRGDGMSIEQFEVEVVNRLNTNSDYQSRFQSAYGIAEVTLPAIGQALADFQSILVANNAPFDRWMRGDANAMSEQQRLGMEEFVDTGCAECHSGPMFSDFDTHVLGVPEAAGLEGADTGNGEFGFRTPSLRQLAFTAPYFHGGQRNSLDDVIDFYDNPGRSENPNVPTNLLDEDFRNLPNINGQRANQIEQFLNALSDDQFDRDRPSSVPSGLPVGGSIE